MYTVKLKFKSVYISNVDENEITPLLDILFFFDENSEYGNKAFSIYPNTTEVLEIPIEDKEAYDRDVEIGYLKMIPCKQDTIFMPVYSDYSIYKEAEKAYSEGNITLLERYVNIVDEDEIIEQGEIKYLQEKEKKYQKLLGEAEEVLRIIKNSFPYTEKDLLIEERETRKRKDKINKETQELEEEIKVLEKDLSKLLKDKK